MSNNLKQLKNVPELRFPAFTLEWLQVKLGDICEIKTGDKDTQNKCSDGLYPFFVRSGTPEKINSYSFDGEAILTSGDGVGVGKNFHYINGRFDFHQRVYSLRNFKEDFLTKFVYYVFSEQFLYRVRRMTAKNSVDSVRMDMITDMTILAPELDEQKAIISFLDIVNYWIEILTKQKDELEKYKLGMMQKIFSQEVRFKNEAGKKFPAWQTLSIGEVFERITTKNINNNRNVLTISAQQGLVNQETFFTKSVSAKDVTGYYLLKKGDFAYNKSYSKGYPIGAIKRLTKYDSGVVSTLYICFRPKSNVSGDYFEHFFNSGSANHAISRIVQEGARNHGLLNMAVDDFFDAVKFEVPSIEEQKNIAKFLTSIDELIVAKAEQLQKAELWKKGLLQKMFV